MTDKPLYEQIVEIGAAKPEAWDEFCAEQHAINAEDHRRADMVTIDRFEHWWDDGDHDDGPTPLGPLSKETARWIWRAALVAQPAEPVAQEPVAWLWRLNHSGKAFLMVADSTLRESLTDAFPVYAAPAAVPLTDEQFADIVADASIQADLAADPIKLLAFARAVLAASGEKT